MGEPIREAKNMGQGGHETASKPQYAPLPILLYYTGTLSNRNATQKCRGDAYTTGATPACSTPLISPH
jgi:hypothetical protein